MTGARARGEGFGYRIIYVEPVHLSDALRALRGRPYPLPFVREPVSTNASCRGPSSAAFRLPLEPLAADSLLVDLAEGLLDAERDGPVAGGLAPVDAAAAERARQFLDARENPGRAFDGAGVRHRVDSL